MPSAPFRRRPRQPESDRDEIAVSVDNPWARRVVVYTWNCYPDLSASDCLRAVQVRWAESVVDAVAGPPRTPTMRPSATVMSPFECKSDADCTHPSKASSTLGWVSMHRSSSSSMCFGVSGALVVVGRGPLKVRVVVDFGRLRIIRLAAERLIRPIQPRGVGCCPGM